MWQPLGNVFQVIQRGRAAVHVTTYPDVAEAQLHTALSSQALHQHRVNWAGANKSPEERSASKSVKDYLA